jgi:hypothetical protein
MTQIIIPSTPKMPFAVAIPGYMGWEPGYPVHYERDYFIVYEAAKILLKKKIIRRTSIINMHSQDASVDGLQQTRLWIREKKITASLYRGSNKYGYLIPKKAFAEFYTKMTGDDFIEDWFLDCLIVDGDSDYFEFKENECRRKIEKLKEQNKKIKEKISSGNGTDEDNKQIEKNNKTLVYLADVIEVYRQQWYKTIFNEI